MKILSPVIAGVLLLSILAITFPVLAPYFDDGRRAAYRQVLGFHAAGRAPGDFGAGITGRGQQPFLYASWFPKDESRHADEFALYSNGHVQSRRVLWDFAIQGGGGQARDPVSFAALQQWAPLPVGLASPDHVPYLRLLIVSQAQAGGWRTLFYDRRSLPATVRQMIQKAASAGAPVGALAAP